MALLWGLFDGENLGVEHIVGMASILLGVYIINARKKARLKMSARPENKKPYTE
ncbi:MAG: hypothetical protein U5L96_18385 [Owenweeksia sp.]|nr:hypothetical protein [Owenweeksia sp.]